MSIEHLLTLFLNTILVRRRYPEQSHHPLRAAFSAISNKAYGPILHPLRVFTQRKFRLKSEKLTHVVKDFLVKNGTHVCKMIATHQSGTSPFGQICEYPPPATLLHFSTDFIKKGVKMFISYCIQYMAALRLRNLKHHTFIVHLCNGTWHGKGNYSCHHKNSDAVI